MTEVDVQAIRARADDMGSVSLAEVQALCDEAERLRAVIAEVEGLAKLDRKCPCCTGYTAILTAIGGGA